MRRVLESFTFRAIILAFLLSYLSFADSSTHDEPSHLASGIYDLHVGKMDLYYVNPPLTRMLAAIPASFFFDGAKFTHAVEADQLTHWGGGAGGFLWQQEGRRAEFWLSLGRLLLIPIMILGLWSTEQFSKDLYGTRASHLAGWLYVSCPTLLAAGHSIAADGTCSALLITSCLAFHRWVKEPSWRNGSVCGGVLGLALLTKTVVIFLPVLFFAYWIVSSIVQDRVSKDYTWFSCCIKFLLINVLALLVLNSGYGFRGTFEELGNYEFVSSTLAGNHSTLEPQGASGEEAIHKANNLPVKRNRFSNTWISKLPVPLPAYYIYGIDRQKKDFDLRIPTNIGGIWKQGSWDDQIWAFLVKVPTGTIALLLLAVVNYCLQASPRSSGGSALLLLVLIGFYALNLSQTNMTIFFRYLAPGFPILYVLISSLLRPRPNKEKQDKDSWIVVPTKIANCFLLLTVIHVAWCFPYVTAYCNEWIGGPWEGQAYYAGANEYGQNLWRLEDQLSQIPPGDRIYVCEYYRQMLLATVPGEYELIPSTTALKLRKNTQTATQLINSGWFICTRHDIYPPMDSIGSSFLNRFEPVKSIAPGLFLYHLSDQDVQSVYDN